MIFLSSIPRSGSTLLTSLLNQRPDVYATPTSHLCNLLGAEMQMWKKHLATQAQGSKEEDLLRILKSIIDSRYDTNKLVFDKSRGWADTKNIKTISLFQDVKIVATVRPIADCLASLAKIHKVSKDEIEAFCKSNFVEDMFISYNTLRNGYETFPNKFLLIEYDNLVNNPSNELDRISDFVGIKTFVHNLTKIADSQEKDKVWGVPNLHKVRPKISKSKYSAKKILGKKLYDNLQGGEFWNDKPEPVRKKQPIQIQHDALMKGNFAKSKELAYKNLANFPNDTNIAFNAGWAKLSDGDVANGYRLLDKGRATNVWGDPLTSSQPVWNGKKGTVLLRLERGLGDQVQQVRYARELKKSGCTVVVSCSPELAPLLNTIPEVDVVVQQEADGGVYHDYFLPAMSTPIQLGYKTNDNIDGTPYIPRPDVEVVKGRVGVRWQGFNGYEHQTKRKFSADLMFDAVKDQDCISLQRNEGSEIRPRWMQSVPLHTWMDTAKAVASCELVVTSCTSVAHLAGAMGVPTWIVVPYVPYYLWTYPGSTTPYYNSMTLYRQTEIDNWEEPFKTMNFNKGLAHAA